MEYYDLGSYSRKIATAVPDAQLWFDRGLNWLFGFNHAEAIACFKKVLELDPNCAIAYWGISYAAGPNYNLPWYLYDPAGKAAALATAYDALQGAMARIERASPVEQALIRALPARYPQREAVEDQAPWDAAYADAMRSVFHAYRDDLEVREVFVEAIMNLTPWKMWDLKTGGVAEGAGTLEAMEVLDSAFRDFPRAWDHPGLLHLYVHLMEMSPFPQRALRAGDRLRDLVPDAGHLIHMPTHIDVLCGHYRNVVDGNHRAIIADRKYLAREGADNFYSLYRCHDLHFKLYGALFLGQLEPALEAADELIGTLSEQLLRIESPPMADWLEGFVPMKMHALIRFGRWDEIIAQKLPGDRALFCVTSAMMRYARAVAFAATGRIAEAEAEAQQFDGALAQVPPSRYLFNNTCLDILAIAREMMRGEIEYRKGRVESAFVHLRKSVELDDNLPYDEPWGWMQPTRHALGALLLEQGRVAEAEAVYRSDLGFDGKLSRACQHPENVWSLHGLYECLTRRGDTVEAPLIKARLDLAMARCEVPIRASCLCRREAA